MGIWFKRILAAILCLSMGAIPASVWAEGAEDSEASLRELLGCAAPGNSIGSFYYNDYDGDGICEAFAVLNQRETDWGISGDIWFVSPLFCDALQTGRAYMYLEMSGEKAPILFSAEEGYGGSGSTSYLWTVADSLPVAVNLGDYENFSYGGNGEFYAYPSEFDMYSDGTGHTWKRYYFYLNGRQMVEYGGIYITRDQLEEFLGAREILERAEGEGFSIGEIIYRGNGVINVNLSKTESDGTYYDNLTLRYDETSVVDTGERFGGIYKRASNPEAAAYPQDFVHPVNQTSAIETDDGAAETAAANAQTAVDFVPQAVVNGDGSYTIDLGNDGSLETIRVCTNTVADLYGYDEIIAFLDVYDQSGQQACSVFLEEWYSGAYDSFDVRFRIAQTAPGELYIEAMSHLDGTRIIYTLYDWNGNALLLKKGVYDPGYSGGEGLYSYDYVGVFDRDSNKVLYETDWESHWRGEYSDGLSALNGEYAPYGLEFASQKVSFHHGSEICNGEYNLAVIPQEKLICQLYKADLQSDSATGKLTNATYDEAQDYTIYEQDTGAFETSMPSASGTGYVRASADVNVRSEANKDSLILGVLPGGEQLSYAGEMETDSRGVIWYKVFYGDGCGWISSKYGELNG